MISNRLWKIFLMTGVLLYSALILVSPRLEVNAEGEIRALIQQVTYRFTGHTPISPLDELAVYQFEPSIAVDDSGNAYAVWTDYRNGDADIYIAYRPAGGDWGTNVKINDDVGATDQYEPSIAVDANKNAFAVWTDKRNGDEDIYFAYRPTGGNWGVNIKINDDSGTSSQSQADIAVNSSGNAFAVWIDERNGLRDIYFASRPLAGFWSANAQINDDPASADKNNPAIAADNSGNVTAVWDDERNGEQDIYSAYRTAGGGWGINLRVNAELDWDANQYAPDVALDAAGNAYAVWNDPRRHEYEVYFSYRAVDGEWEPDVRVSNNSDSAPAIAVDANGNAYAAWGETLDWFTLNIYSAYKPSGGIWGSKALIDGDASIYKGNPSLAMSADGQAFVAWTRYLDDRYDVYSAYHPVVGSWSGIAKINDDTGASPQFNPSLAVSPDGTAYAIWEDSYNSDPIGNIYASVRMPDGSWGAREQVNDGLGSAWKPAIAVDGEGNAYAVWQDYRNGDWDIYFASRPAGGTWGANVRVNDVGTWEQAHPAIAVDSSGNAYAVWDDNRDSNEFNIGTDIYFAYRPAGGDWGANVSITPGPDTTWQTHPSIAVDSLSNAYALWDSYIPNGAFFAYRPSGGNWSAPEPVRLDQQSDVGERLPDIAVDPGGNAYAVWGGQREGFYSKDIFFGYRPANGDWGESIMVNEDDGDLLEGNPAIAVDAVGNAYAVWEDYPNYHPYIYFSYRPAGGSWSSNTLVDRSSSTRLLEEPDIGVDDVGNVYVVWADWRIASAAIYFAQATAGYVNYLPFLGR